MPCAAWPPRPPVLHSLQPNSCCEDQNERLVEPGETASLRQLGHGHWTEPAAPPWAPEGPTREAVLLLLPAACCLLLLFGQVNPLYPA